MNFISSLVMLVHYSPKTFFTQNFSLESRFLVFYACVCEKGWGVGGEGTHASELVAPLNAELLTLDTVCC